MAKRKIIKIDVDKCTGCGKCIPECPEGAIQIIDAKARLISDLFCDGLGACIGSCPESAIIIEQREAQEYDEKKVMENIAKQGENTIIAHLKHLRDHGQTKYLEQGIDFLKEKKVKIPQEFTKESGISKIPTGCPGRQTLEFGKESGQGLASGEQPSALRQWPIQLHLVSPLAPYFQEADVLISADCVGYALGSFHSDYLRGKSLAIACPKLDSEKEIYVDKIKALADEAKINTLTVMIMQVPCCGGLLAITKQALKAAKRKVPLKCTVVGTKGEVLSEEWVRA